MSASLLSIGLTGLNAAQLHLSTTGHNISNASTPGYTRQQVMQQSNSPMFTGAGFLGTGTSVETVKRLYNDLLTTQLRTAQSGAAQMDSYLAQISQINNLLAEPSSGMTPVMSGFFASLSDAAANPTSTPARQAFLSSVQTLVSRFQSLDQRINELRTGVNRQIDSEITSINAYARQLADINQKILVAQAAGDAQPANDIHDQRDQLLSELNQIVSISAIPQTDGTYAIFFGTGQPLVIGNEPARLQAIPDPYDKDQMVLALQLYKGESMILPESQITGGRLGGLVSFRTESLNPAQNALGRIAITMAETFNAQHRLGQDLTGALGKDVFKVPAPEVLAHSANHKPVVEVTAKLVDVGALTTSDYQLTSSGNGLFTLVRLSDNKMLVSNSRLPDQIDGFSLSLDGTPPAGDSYLIRPVRSGAHELKIELQDPRNLALAAPTRTQTPLTNTGSATISPVSVDSVTATPPGAAITLRYLNESGQHLLDGFPVGALVDNGGAKPIRITDPTTKVPFIPGQTLSFNGLAFSLEGVPAHGDAFTIKPPTDMQTGYRSLVGQGVDESTDSGNHGVLTGKLELPASTTITSGQNDRLLVNVGGVGAQEIILTPGSYTPAQLATELQTQINAAFPAHGVSAITNPYTGKLVMTTLNAGETISLGDIQSGVTNTGYADLLDPPAALAMRGTALAGHALPAFPLTITAGQNDSFDLSVDGGPATTITLAAGSYATQDALVTALQTQIGGAATVKATSAGKLQITSATTGGASAVTLSANGVNAGYSQLFGAGTTSGQRAELVGGQVLTDPTDIIAGKNDRFAVDLNGGGAQTVLLPAGRYSPAALAKQLEATLNQQFGANSVEVGLSGGALSIISNDLNPATSSVAVADVSSGSGRLTLTNEVSRLESLPSAPITLSYRSQDQSFTGFPVGAVVTVDKDPASPYKIENALTPVRYLEGATISFNGLSFTLNGAPAEGDRFIIEPNNGGVSDNRNALKLGGLQTAKLLDGGNTSYQGAYSSMVNQIGNKTREVQVYGEAMDSMVKQAQDARDSVSAVNLDEEAANLLRYQQAYQASARVISITGKLFDSLLEIR